MSQEKATKYLVIGIILAVAFGTLIIISFSLTANASVWSDYENALNLKNLNEGVYGIQEYNARATEITLTATWMAQQQLYLGTIGRIGMNIGLILVIIGFIGYATNNQMDEHTRRTCIFIAGLVVFVLLLSFTGGLFFGISGYP